MTTKDTSEPLIQELTTPNGHTYYQPLGLFIDNEFVSASTTTPITAIDPATEKTIANVQSATSDDVDRAVQCAKRALHCDSWKQISGTERGNLIAKLASLMDEKKELLASVVSWENGLPYTSALEEDVTGSIETIRYFGGWADKINGQIITPSPQKLAYTIRQPIGVVGQIIPWNSPLMMAGWKLGPALACGNTVVLKAAEQTPLSILLLAQLIEQAGFPPGVVNLINGRGEEAGSALVQHPLVDKIAFTGSTTTAQTIMSLASKTLKNITLETGGKSPFLVFPDADMDQAVKWAHLGIMAYSGQICTSTSRILVHRDIYHAFVARFQQAVNERSIVGGQWDKDSFQGPQVSKAQFDRVISYIEKGKNEGAKLLTGGSACPINGKGYYVQPTVFVDVTPSMTIYREEIFGPVVVICSFKDEKDAISQANDTIYGLGASVFTCDLERAHRVSAEIEAGTVWVNSSQDCDFRIPFGGVKQSGIGRELGEEGLEAYSQVKAVHINMGTRL
ncbi:mitochondrial aldehyde dehydrogenase [Metarhizium acridum]|uniref:mitochondrial aldehyde dehydrogenase n=1 Tax=Metarhizium acridum TaxID=92637 RepID=UPI001C6C0F58|nr:mitochondrial aldehyde dehydrogenase [Metarhizium acridum]KAG8415851.1 mitochondrial aldehyde dehydrogenase [Metarhizium acridum]